MCGARLRLLAPRVQVGPVRCTKRTNGRLQRVQNFEIGPCDGRGCVPATEGGDTGKASTHVEKDADLLADAGAALMDAEILAAAEMVGGDVMKAEAAGAAALLYEAEEWVE